MPILATALSTIEQSLNDRESGHPIANAGDALTSFNAAAEAAMKYLEAERLSLEQAKALQLAVVPVVSDPQSNNDCGIKIVSPPHAA